MHNLNDYATNYLRPFSNDFWRWSDEGTVIEWFDGQTIAFRDEVLDVLQYIEEDSFVPFGTIVLALAACQENWKSDDRAAYIKALIDPADKLAETFTKQYIRTTQEFLEGTIAHMNTIRQLPATLRQGSAKTYLVRHLMAGGDSLRYLARQAMPMIIDLRQGNIRNIVVASRWRLESKVLDSTLAPFYIKRNTTVEALEAELRTGISQLLPVDSRPESQSTTLLDVLHATAETRGLARLTKHVVAALKIPMHALTPAQHLPIGGVSDLANRGTLDKLLLTELAQDDTMLMARLANNEALYLRREEPPEKTPRHQVLLIDTTLRMWGIPRIFAASVALAYLEKINTRATVDAYALSANGFTALDLTSRQGVLTALEQMDPALDCVDGLNRFFQTSGSTADPILITDAESITQPEMQLALAKLNTTLRLLVTVSRNGGLKVYEYVQGNRHLIENASFDLESFIVPPLVKRAKTDAPEFLTAYPPPLRFSFIQASSHHNDTYQHPDIGVLNITYNRRLLYWRSPMRGAVELLNPIDSAGLYCFGHTDRNTVYILADGHRSDRKPVLYTITLSPTIHIEKEVLPQIIHSCHMAFKDDCFLIAGSGNVSINVKTKAIEAVSHVHRSLCTESATRSRWRGFPCYRTLHELKTIFVTKDGQLILNGYALSLLPQGVMRLTHSRLKAGTDDYRPTAVEKVTLGNNSRLSFQRFEWPNGSVALVDPRGLLHLQSASPDVPEVTITLSLSIDLAAWTPDGTRCGPEYYLDKPQPADIRADLFYRQYIQHHLANLR